jgi:uncharacterized OB-fold protein
MAQTIPAVGYLELGDVPRLVAQECVGCGALYFDRRNACARCSGTEFGRRALSNEGVLRAYTIVHRAAPGLEAPYISAVVDLEGGGVVKANLRGVTGLAEIYPEMKVRLVTFPAGQDDDGTSAVAFGYEPMGAS